MGPNPMTDVFIRREKFGRKDTDTWRRLLVAPASWGCHNKVPYTGWLSSNRKLFSHFQRSEVQNQSVIRAVLSQKALGKDPSLPRPSFWRLLAILGVLGLKTHPSLLPPPPGSHGSSLCVCTFVSKFPSFYKDTSHWTHLGSIQVGPHLNLTVSVGTLFPNKVIGAGG